jgi:hypothetical protein
MCWILCWTSSCIILLRRVAISYEHGIVWTHRVSLDYV